MRTSEILETFKDYYSTLYSTSNFSHCDIWTFFRKHILDKRLTEEHAQMLDNPITLVEVSSTINYLKNGKSPGNGSFPVEFYKQYTQHPSLALFGDFNAVPLKLKTHF